jgi:anti-anti-sigma factor
MSETNGKCLFVQKEGIAIFKIVGQLRFNTSGGLASKIEGLHLMSHIQDIIIDMSETDFVDSTVLGLIAQLGKRHTQPIIMYEHEQIHKLLKHLGLDKFFLICKKTQASPLEMDEIFQELAPPKKDSEDKLKKRIEQAHKLLYEIDEKNKIEFGDVVNYLFKPHDG